MASPLEQNKRHVEVLAAVINEMRSPQPRGYLPYVVVSSKARIDRPKKFDTSQVVKADQFLTTFDKDLDKIGVTGIIGTIFDGALFSDPHVRLAERLVERHRPIELNYASRFLIAERRSTPSVSTGPLDGAAGRPRQHAPSPQVPVLVQKQCADDASVTSKITGMPSNGSLGRHDDDHPRCRACDSTKLHVAHGRYGYYFKCRVCAANTPIRISCGKAGHEERIRKAVDQFYRECAACQTSSVFFRNV